MSVGGLTGILFIGLLTVVCGIGDALGFIHAGKVWQAGRFDWSHALKSAAGFQLGVVTYWIVVRLLTGHGVVSVEIQTLFWFAATIVGVALLSGQVLRWPLIDKAVASCVLAGVGWLMYRTAR